MAPIADLVLAAVLGGIALYIAYQQWRTHQSRVASEERDRCLKRRDDLFDRRWKIYLGVGDFLDAMAPETMTVSAAAQRVPEGDDFAIAEQALSDLKRLMLLAQFLFDRDVNEYLAELEQRCRNMLLLKLKSKRGGQLPEQVAEEWAWWSDQRRVRDLNQRFERYLRLS
ncbi:MAG: hypothetical protein OXG04_18955 [Acidobacteria bacterium]|nr:hypothetical protein [Acidobacteriota bacterium]